MVDPSRVPRGRQQAITNSRLQRPIGELTGELLHLRFLAACMTRVEMRGNEDRRRVSYCYFCSNKSLVAEKLVVLKDKGMLLENGMAGKNADA